MQFITAAFDPSDQDFPGQPPERNPILDEYDARRCAICGVRFPPFGFGPPLTKRDVVLWACGTHYTELNRRLTERRTAPAEDLPQFALF